MYEYLIFGIAFGGTMIAALLDLWTTEVPDSISIIVGGISFGLHVYLSWMTGDISYAVWSLGLGLGFLAGGWLLYWIGGWGGADAVVLGSLGFALPYVAEVMAPLGQTPWPYPVSFLLNVLIVGSIYSIGYAAYKGVTVEGVMQSFLEDLKRYSTRMIAVILSVTALLVTVAVVAHLNQIAPLSESVRTMGWYIPLLIGLLILYRYLRVIEDEGLVIEKDVEDVVIGDVVVESVELEAGDIHPQRIVGIEEEQLEELHETRETVPVQHGVRFVLTFPLAFAATAFYGDLILVLMTMMS